MHACIWHDKHVCTEKIVTEDGESVTFLLQGDTITTLVNQILAPMESVLLQKTV